MVSIEFIIFTGKTGTDAVGEYGHRYDSLNRLTASDYTSLVGSTWTNTSNYDVNGIIYDNNGNVQTMTQYGKVDPNTFNKIDQLSYTYEGNRLVKVSDAIAPNPSRSDFSDGVELVTVELEGVEPSDQTIISILFSAKSL